MAMVYLWRFIDEASEREVRRKSSAEEKKSSGKSNFNVFLEFPRFNFNDTGPYIVVHSDVLNLFPDDSGSRLHSVLHSKLSNLRSSGQLLRTCSSVL